MIWFYFSLLLLAGWVTLRTGEENVRLRRVIRDQTTKINELTRLADAGFNLAGAVQGALEASTVDSETGGAR